MVHLIYGKSGTGKSEYVFSRIQRTEDSHIFLFVPDREAVAAEGRVAEFPSAATVDVVTFRRFCNYVFRQYGGLCEDYISAGAKKLLMRNVLSTLAPVLPEYGKATGFGTVEKLCTLRSELYLNGISPADLGEASEKMEKGTPLCSKASELAVIFSAYDLEIASKWADPDGILSRTEAVLAKNDFFRGCTVFIDGFTSFSAEQYALIERMAEGAEDVYITLSYSPEDPDDSAEKLLADTDRRLRRAFERAGATIKRTVLSSVKRYKNDELAFLGERLPSSRGRAIWRRRPESITLMRGVNAFAEAEAAALNICRLIRLGARYRDMVVVVRNTASAEGVVDAVFRKYDIPCFLSGKRDISDMPLVTFVFSALAVTERGFRGSDLIPYLKTGLCGLTADESSLFENYIVKWNLRGKAFTEDTEWTMHPRGYGEYFSEEDSATLAAISDIRSRVIPPLLSFAAAMRRAKTVRERATVLFDHLVALKVSEALSERAEAYKAKGKLALAAETVGLWNAFCGALDQLVISSGDYEVGISEFSKMLHIILMDTDIGKIPTSMDEVTVVSAAQTVSGQPKYVYLLGVNEGVFPERVGEDGIFSEREKESLLSFGLEFTSRRERRVSEELFFFFRAAALPSERLYISYSHYDLSGGELRESVGVKRIRALFPKLPLTDFEKRGKITLIESPRAAFEHALSFGGSLGEALRLYYEDRSDYAEKLQYASVSLSAENEHLTPEGAKELFGNSLNTSYSKLEAYIKCRFSYFCEYELDLKDDLPAKFSLLNIGSFVHGILERVVKWIADGGKGDMEAEIGRIADTYIASAFSMPCDMVPKRFTHLFDHLRKSVLLFARRMEKEFAQSSFRPCDFELTVGEGENVLPMVLKNENITISLRGKIDRVDAYEGGDGKLHLRVVDYKTGDKTMNLEHVKLGLDMQMLLYLFSLWENGERYYKKEIVPAGAMYAIVGSPQINGKVGDDVSLEEMKMTVSGIFLHDEETLRAMEPALEGEFIPVKASDVEKGKQNLLGLDALKELKQEVAETVLRIADELRQGDAPARPKKTGRRYQCEFCNMKPVCRIGSIK